MWRLLFLCSIALVLLLAPDGPAYGAIKPYDTFGTRSDITQQPDPKKRTITASVARSAQDETLSLNANFPEDVTNIKVALYNILGKLIEVHPVTSAAQGDQIFRFITKGLPSGPYIIVLESNGQRIVNKVMVSR